MSAPERPALTVLHPAGPGARVIEPDPAESELAALYARDAAVPPGRPHVRANMISTLDGAAYGPDGRSGSINGAADLRVFTVLRALSEVVLVGAGTVRTERYRAPRTPGRLHAVRRSYGLPADPVLAVVTRSGDLPEELLGDDPTPWVFTTSNADGLARLRLLLPSERLHVSDRLDLAQVLGVLAAAGVRRVLTEGGPSLLTDLVAAHLVDELCLTLAPVLASGPAPRILGGGWLSPAAALRPVHLLRSEDGVLLGRWRLAAQ